jgi:hypothetical protein
MNSLLMGEVSMIVTGIILLTVYNKTTIEINE